MRISTKFCIITLLLGVFALSGMLCLYQFFLIPSHINNKIEESWQIAYYLQKIYPLLDKGEEQAFINDLMTWEDELSYLLIVDQNGKAIVHSDPKRQGMIFEDQGTLSAARDAKTIQQNYTRDPDDADSPVCGEQVIDILLPAYDKSGKHVGAINVGVSLKQLNSLKQQYYLGLLIVTGIIVFFLLIIAAMFKREIIIPLRQLSSAIREVKKGNYEGVGSIKSNNELGILAVEFNSMSEKISILMDESRKRENEMQEYIDQLITMNGKITSDGKIIMINARVLDKLNMTNEEIISTNLWELPCWDFDEDGKNCIKAHVESAASGHTAVFQQLTRDDNEEYLILDISIKPVFNIESRVVYMVVEGRDISEQKRAEKVLQKVHEDLEMRVNLRTAELEYTNKQLKTQVGERERVEKALLKSEDNLRKQVNYLNILMDSLNEMFYTYTPNGVINFVNRKSRDLLQYEPEELLGHRVTFFVADEYRPQREIEVYKCLYQGKDSTFETVLTCKDGTQKAVRINASPIIEDGKIIGAMSLAEDITGRKLSEEALRKSEDRFSKAFHASPGIMFITSFHENRFIDVNGSFMRITGYSRSEIIGHRVEDIGFWKDGTNLRRQLLQNNGVIRDQETVFITKFEEERCWQFSTELIELKDESCVLVVISDITERKRAVEALAAEKERLSVTLSSIGDGVIATNFEGNIALTNEAASKVLGMSREELEGKDFRKVLQLFPLEQKVINRITNGQIVYEINNHVLVHKTGHERLIEANGAPIRNTNKKFWGLVWVIRDITEKQRMEEEMIKASKLESLGVLAGGLAHDFNNLLTVVAGNISLGRMLIADSDEVCEFLHEAEKATSQAKGLTQQLLTFARGGAPIKKTASIAKLLCDSVQFTLSGSNIIPEFEISDNLWNVEVDEGQISQVINNLIINAMQAMPDGGKIQISAENQFVHQSSTTLPLKIGNYVKIVIRDKGSGIPEKYQGNVFDPYFTTKENGTGLGLATAYSIINRHGGYITFLSKPGLGTTFFIYLPVADKTAEMPVDAVKTLVKGRGRILVMDDEYNIRKILNEMIASLGYEVELARDGRECIKIYKQSLLSGKPFAAVIMDLTVPGGMGGKEAAEKLLKIDPDVKVIVSSGYSNDPVMSEYKKWGFKGIINKPYGIQDISQILQQVIGNN